MTIDLRSFIKDDKAIKSGGYTGAVFLTYTLNLNFYEQMIAPWLDQAGCANVLILADPDGYSGALEMGSNTISGVGLRYVCAPVMRTGGVQHAKLLFMAGAKFGRLLIGSGNLTMHGYGRNLEMFSHFECDIENSELEDRYPFIQAWSLIEKIAGQQELPQAAQNQIGALRENVSWIKERIPAPSNFSVWHNFDQPILTQLNAWRAERGWNGLPVRDVDVISPYFDKDTIALHSLVEDLMPDKVRIHLDPDLTNLDGQKAVDDWQIRGLSLDVVGIGPGEETSMLRHVHAKSIICKDVEGAWCLSGSANMSSTALLRSWQAGGNLELDTFRWSPNPTEYEALLQDPTIKTWPLSLAEITVTESEPSERTTHLDSPFILTDLSARGLHLEGRVIETRIERLKNPCLNFLRSKWLIPIQLDPHGAFRLELPAPLEIAEAAKVEAGNLETPFRWIDQPESLARFGARSYQARVKGKLETIQGAEQLFRELMNYLWERVDIQQDEDDSNRGKGRSKNKKNGNRQESQDGPQPPGPEGFITDEKLVRTIHWGIESQHPYDRSLYSLRDLLSLVLLRLTIPTQAAPDIWEETRDEDAEQQRDADREVQQIKAIERLRNFILDYSKRYGRRLSNPEFMQQKSPELIFQNHYTLGRVLLEFASKADIARGDYPFTQNDLYRCFWWVWAPIVWPSVVLFEGMSTLKLLQREYSAEQIARAWVQNGLPSLTAAIMCRALGHPPSCRAGVWDPKRVANFMVAAEWIRRIRQSLGEDALLLQLEELDQATGIRSLEDVENPMEIPETELIRLKELFSRIENYLPPMQEKYLPLIKVDELIRIGKTETTEYKDLVAHIHKEGLSREYEAYCKKPVRIISNKGEDDYCPRCSGMLTQIAIQSLKHGNLVLCSKSKDAWIYHQPKIPAVLEDVS